MIALHITVGSPWFSHHVGSFSPLSEGRRSKRSEVLDADNTINEIIVAISLSGLRPGDLRNARSIEIY
jgi:hypothetical protein